MSEGNGGTVIDEGLAALKMAFDDSKFYNNYAKQCAELIIMGAHREMNIPDAVIMEVYGSITEGKKMSLKFETNAGKGFIANIESYGDLISFMKGKLQCNTFVRVDT